MAQDQYSWGWPPARWASGARGSPGRGWTGLADGERPGRPKAGLVLTDAERDQLMRWSRRAKTAQALALRSKIVLACAQGSRTSRWPPSCGSRRAR